MQEIILGIIGNLCCHKAVIESVGKNVDLRESLFKVLCYFDSAVLIQLLRLLKSIFINVDNDRSSTWLKELQDCKQIGKTIAFVLQSSTNGNISQISSITEQQIIIS